MTRGPLTPAAFVEGCRRGRPTKHLHGWSARELADMVEALLTEHAQVLRENTEMMHRGNREYDLKQEIARLTRERDDEVDQLWGQIAGRDEHLSEVRQQAEARQTQWIWPHKCKN